MISLDVEARASRGLVGRDEELRFLTSVLDEVHTQGRSLFLTGEPGVGKTALLGAVAAEASRRGWLVLSSRASQAESHLSFAALHQLVRPLLPRLDDLPPGHRDALRIAFGMSSGEQSADRLAIALGVLELVADTAAERPVLLTVDDLPWADTASRDAIEFVARRLESEPAIMVITSRTRAAEVRGMVDDPSVVRMRLGALDSSAANSLLTEHGGSLAGPLKRRVLDDAQGNPLALLELPAALNARSARSDAPVDVLPLTVRLEQAFAARFSGLPPHTRALLLVAALADGREVAELLTAASHLTGRDLQPSELAPLVDVDLIDINGVVVQFRHPLVRSAVHHAATDQQRREAHAALARSLSGDPDRAAWHRSAAASGPDDDMAAELDAAADRALARGAIASAQDWLERAARSSETPRDRGHRLLRAAEIAYELGRRESVQRLLRAAQALEPGPADRARIAWLDYTFDDGTPGDATHIGHLVGSARRALAAGDADLAAQFIGVAARGFWWGDPGAVLRREVLNIADRLGEVRDGDPRVLAAMAVAAPVERGRVVLDRLASSAQQGPPDVADAGTLAHAAFHVGDFDRTLVLVEQAADSLRLQGRLGLLAQALVLRTYAALQVGRWDVMYTAADEAHRLASETGQPGWAAAARIVQANVVALRGLSDQARDLLDGVERTALLAGHAALVNAVEFSRGLAALSVERPDDAFEHFSRIMHHPSQRIWAADYLADAAVACGRVEQARAILADMEPLLDITPAPGVHRALRYALAVLAEDDVAEERFAGAARVESSASPWFRARLDLARGSWLRRQRRVAESRVPLRSSRAIFDALGTTAWSTRAIRELRASGQRDEATPAASWSRLSPQELQIAQLAAQGLSNQEVAARMYLSRRTVESHLYRLFPKLGVSSRAKLHLVLPSAEHG